MNKLFSSDGFPGFGIGRTNGDADDPPLILFFRTLWRHKGFIAAVTFFLTLIAAIVLLRMTPLYTATTVLMLEPERKGTVIDVGAVVAGMPADVSSIESEVEVLRSRGLAQKVADSLGLAQHAEFNPALQVPAPWEEAVASIRSAVTDLIDYALSWLPDSGTSLPPGEYRAGDVVDAFLERTQVESVGRSRAIQIDFTSENPEIAARAAEAIAQHYVVERLEGKMEASKEVSSWLSAQVQNLRADVEEKEQAVAAFREKYDLLKGEGGEALLAQEVSELNHQLSAASAARAEAEAKLAEVRHLMAQGQVASAEAVLESTLIQDLRREEALLEAQVSDYATRFGPRHPALRNSAAQLANIRQTIDREIRKIARGLENALDIARSRETRLRSHMESTKARIVSSNSVEVQLRSLEQEAYAARTLLETFLQDFSANSVKDDILGLQPDARIVSHAEVPVEPSFPKKIPVLALALTSALIASIGLVLLREVMDTSFRASEEIERDTGARVLGHIPRIASWRDRRKGLAHLVAHEPRSFEAEAVRRLCTGIKIAQRDGASNRIMFTSAQAGEGKTSICTAVARAYAAAGNEVLLIDSDIRQAKVHKALGLWQGPGLIELMVGECTLEEVMQRDPKSGAVVIAAGFGRVDRPQDLLSSKHMERLLMRSAKSYDLVILDTPPVSAVSDALSLANLASIVFVIRWGGAPRKIVTRALHEVLDAGGRLIGVALAQVNAKEHIKYGYSDSGIYWKESKKYYSKSEMIKY